MRQFKDICTQCGQCCKHVGLIKGFPYTNGVGVCSKLTKDNKCSIYDNRPLICRVDNMYERFKESNLSKEEFINLNIKTCNILIQEAGIDKKYLIKNK